MPNLRGFHCVLRVSGCCFTPTNQAESPKPIWHVDLRGGLSLIQHTLRFLVGGASNSATLSSRTDTRASFLSYRTAAARFQVCWRGAHEHARRPQVEIEPNTPRPTPLPRATRHRSSIHRRNIRRDRCSDHYVIWRTVGPPAPRSENVQGSPFDFELRWTAPNDLKLKHCGTATK